MYPSTDLPDFYWLKITGCAGVDDFGLAGDHRLVASARAMNLLHHFRIDHADQSAYAAKAG